MSSKNLGATKLPIFDTDEELSKYDLELGLGELRRQLSIIESDKSKQTYDDKKEAFNLRQAIREVEKGKDMPYDEFMAILSKNSIPKLRGSYFKTEIDPESGEEIRVQVEYDNRFPIFPSPKTGLRRRTPELKTELTSISPFTSISRSISPFTSISSEQTRSLSPLLPTIINEDDKKSSICPEGCAISGGIRRRRKTRKTRKLRRSKKNKKFNKKSKRKII